MARGAFFVFHEDIDFGVDEHLGDLALVVQDSYVQGRVVYFVPHVHFDLARVDQEVGGLEQASAHAEMERSITHLSCLLEVVYDFGAGKHCPQSHEEGRNGSWRPSLPKK